MAARAIMKGFDKGTVVTVVVKSGTTTVKGVGVKWDTGQADNAAAGNNAFGIALEAVVGDGVKTCQVLLLSSAGVIYPVKVGSGGAATQGAYAECGTTGFTDRTLGGGSTVRYIAGKWHETGVAGDFCGLEIGQFAGGSA
jgi:hypothetical protein